MLTITPKSQERRYLPLDHARPLDEGRGGKIGIYLDKLLDVFVLKRP